MEGKRGMGSARGASSLKEAIQRREKNQYKRAQTNKLEYMDSM